jgi:hypothetical protein
LKKLFLGKIKIFANFVTVEAKRAQNSPKKQKKIFQT